MNKNPDTTGISRYWKDGDLRMDIRRRTNLAERTIDSVLDAFISEVVTKRRTMLVGFGSFEWRPLSKMIPTGEVVDTWRLAFLPAGKIKRGEHYGTADA